MNELDKNDLQAQPDFAQQQPSNTEVQSTAPFVQKPKVLHAAK
jgi:hypothetical protein